MRISLKHLFCLLLLLCAVASARPYLRVDIRNGMKVSSNFKVTGKTGRGNLVRVQVDSWDGFGADFEVRADRKGRFSIPLSIRGKTITTHVDIIVQSYDLRRKSMSERKRYVILKRGKRK